MDDADASNDNDDGGVVTSLDDSPRCYTPSMESLARRRRNPRAPVVSAKFEDHQPSPVQAIEKKCAASTLPVDPVARPKRSSAALAGNSGTDGLAFKQPPAATGDVYQQLPAAVDVYQQLPAAVDVYQQLPAAVDL